MSYNFLLGRQISNLLQNNITVRVICKPERKKERKKKGGKGGKSVSHTTAQHNF
jgi:hypothetical protein